MESTPTIHYRAALPEDMNLILSAFKHRLSATIKLPRRDAYALLNTLVDFVIAPQLTFTMAAFPEDHSTLYGWIATDPSGTVVFSHVKPKFRAFITLPQPPKPFNPFEWLPNVATPQPRYEPTE